MSKREEKQKEALKLKHEMIGCLYMHFKGGLYIVEDIAVHSEEEDLMVIYKTYGNPSQTWARPLTMFLSDVDHEKYPDVKQQKRFQRIFHTPEKTGEALIGIANKLLRNTRGESENA